MCSVYSIEYNFILHCHLYNVDKHLNPAHTQYIQVGKIVGSQYWDNIFNGIRIKIILKIYIENNCKREYKNDCIIVEDIFIYFFKKYQRSSRKNSIIDHAHRSFGTCTVIYFTLLHFSRVKLVRV